MASFKPYKISRTISNHTNDVKAVKFFLNDSVVTASRDGTAQLTGIDGTNTTLVELGSYLNALAVDESNERVYIGSQDSFIVAYGMEVKEDDYYTDGHAANVSCLDLHKESQLLASGSWDNTVRIWASPIESFALTGHTQYVWDVKFVDATKVLSASADRTIKLWDLESKSATKTFVGHEDVVRSLQVVSSSKFLSASNDGTLRLWDIPTGKQLRVYKGHTSFVYDIALIDSTYVASSGEDRSVRVWNIETGDCVQTIVLPSISQWCVSANENGDIVIGSSDNTARVFSRAPERQGSAEEQAQFEEAVKGSAFGENEIDESQISNPSILNAPGKQEGQVAMVRNERTKQIEAHQYSGGAWSKIGDVVGQNQASGSKREQFNGQQYDYVFDVDIKDGEPPLKLPFNNSDNPYVVAEKFIVENGLPPSYVEQVVQFLIQNSQAKNFDSPSAPARESVSTQSEPVSSTPAAEVPQVLKYSKPLSLKAFQAAPLLKALSTIADERGDNIALYNIGPLLNSLPSSASELLNVSLELKSKWADNLQHLLPILDLLRIAIADAISAPQQVIWVNILSAIEPDLPKHSLLAIRALVNLIARNDFDSNNSISKSMLPQAVSMVQAVAAGAGSSKPMAVALATLALNLAIQSPAYVDFGRFIPLLTTKIIGSGDPESIYRFILAIGLRSVASPTEARNYKKEWFANLPSEKRISDLLEVVNPRIN